MKAKYDKKMKEKVTMYTLAEELNMSIAAISRAFDPSSRLKAEKRKLVLETAEKLGYVPNKMASRLSRNPINIGVLIYGHIAAYYNEMISGINDAYREFIDYKVNCDIRIVKSSAYTAEYAFAVLEEFERNKYDGVIISGLYGEALTELINRMSDKNISTATINFDIPESKRLFASVNNTETAGNMAAQLLGMFIKGSSRNIVLFTGDMSSQGQLSLTDSFLRHAREYGLNILKSYDTRNFESAEAEQVREAFDLFGVINGMYISSANSLPVCRYLETHYADGKEKIALVTSDVFEELNQYIEKGIVDATIYQNPFLQARKAFENLYYYIAEGRNTDDVITVNPQIVIKSNLQLYK